MNPADALSDLPENLRAELLAAYSRVVMNFRERRWEPAELNGGKLCEVVYSLLRGHVDGAYPTSASKPSNMVDACKALEQAGSQFPRSVRIQIPRMIIALYEIRNNRGVGHVGGDVDPNHMDAVTVLAMSKWLVAEVIRLLHSVDIDEAQALADAVVDRQLPLVWEVNGARRVLDPGMTMKEKTFVLLYGQAEDVSLDDLFEWVEHSNKSVYKRDVLRPAHKSKHLEFDEARGRVTLSPTGAELVETNILSRTN